MLAEFKKEEEIKQESSREDFNKILTIFKHIQDRQKLQDLTTSEM